MVRSRNRDLSIGHEPPACRVDRSPFSPRRAEDLRAEGGRLRGLGLRDSGGGCPVPIPPPLRRSHPNRVAQGRRPPAGCAGRVAALDDAPPGARAQGRTLQGDCPIAFARRCARRVKCRCLGQPSQAATPRRRPRPRAEGTQARRERSSAGRSGQCSGDVGRAQRARVRAPRGELGEL